MCPDYSAIFWKVPRLQTRCRSRSQVRLRISQAVPKRARPSFPYSFLSGRGPFRSQCHLPLSSCREANMRTSKGKFRQNIDAMVSSLESIYSPSWRQLPKLPKFASIGPIFSNASNSLCILGREEVNCISFCLGHITSLAAAILNSHAICCAV